MDGQGLTEILKGYLVHVWALVLGVYHPFAAIQQSCDGQIYTPHTGKPTLCTLHTARLILVTGMRDTHWKRGCAYLSRMAASWAFSNNDW